eukprot:2868915-Rhodomonas_salina.2
MFKTTTIWQVDNCLALKCTASVTRRGQKYRNRTPPRVGMLGRFDVNLPHPEFWPESSACRVTGANTAKSNKAYYAITANSNESEIGHVQHGVRLWSDDDRCPTIRLPHRPRHLQVQHASAIETSVHGHAATQRLRAV